MGLGDRLIIWALRKLGGLLFICGVLVAIIYGLYMFFSSAMDIAIPWRVAIAIAGVGFVLLLASITFERLKSSEEEEELKEIEQ
ncbi:MAG TPA: hypothetical protein G4O13_06080 [Dehalococcoidia bacterium]|nr:hypothetical protein [Dehalococcoidia bacterium]